MSIKFHQRIEGGRKRSKYGKPVSVRNLVEGWIAENDWRIKLNLGHHPYPDYEPMAFWGDHHKLDQYMESA